MTTNWKVYDDDKDDDTTATDKINFDKKKLT